MGYPKFIFFNGDQYKLVGQYYRRYKWGTPGPRNLHRAIWEFHNGPIPEGCHIHHKDGNTMNNSPDNLECLTMHDHRSQHATEMGCWSKSDKNKENLGKIRPKAVAWHGSPEGHAWHVEHGKDTWRVREKTHTLTCQHCGTVFTSFWATAKMCSRNCIAAARRASGVDNEDRVCVTCGGTFSTNKYLKQRNCSKACANVAQSRTKRLKT